MEAEIVALSVNRLNNMVFNVYEAIEETGIDITDVEYYITTCKNSIRSKYYPEYKAGRKSLIKKWVSKVRSYIKDEMHFAIGNDIWEADDLVYDRAKEIGANKCIILTIDKDLKAIGGILYDFYTIPVLDENNEPILNEYGDPAKEYRGLSVVTEEEAKRFHYLQVIWGDSGDNIKGAKGFGEGRANKILDSVDSDQYEIAALNAYYEAELKELKKYLNTRSNKYKKLNFDKFSSLIDDEDITVDKEGLHNEAMYKYTLNKFLIELGTNRDPETYKILNK